MLSPKTVLVFLAIVVALVVASTTENLLEYYIDDDMRSTNSAGINLIKSFEGFRSCKYKDRMYMLIFKCFLNI